MTTTNIHHSGANLENAFNKVSARTSKTNAAGNIQNSELQSAVKIDVSQLALAKSRGSQVNSNTEAANQVNSHQSQKNEVTRQNQLQIDNKRFEAVKEAKIHEARVASHKVDAKI